MTFFLQSIDLPMTTRKQANALLGVAKEPGFATVLVHGTWGPIQVLSIGFSPHHEPHGGQLKGDRNEH